MHCIKKIRFLILNKKCSIEKVREAPPKRGISAFQSAALGVKFLKIFKSTFRGSQNLEFQMRVKMGFRDELSEFLMRGNVENVKIVRRDNDLVYRQAATVRNPL